MKTKRIRIGSSESVFSQNVKNKINFDMKQHTKLFPFSDVNDLIDQYEVFEDERSKCEKYRLIVTINPYCSNILFNAVTEIVQDEGDKKQKLFLDTEGVNFPRQGKDDPDPYGKKSNVLRNEMIANTEYSRPEYNIKYNCGLDIFNNHILRNKSFKIVNPPNSYDDEHRKIFNTISDEMRMANTKNTKGIRRKNIEIWEWDFLRHLYIHDDIYRIANGDIYNAKLTEDNGWYGFVNNSTIGAKKQNGFDEDNLINWEDMNISKVINSQECCDFIDMYPDRTLFSFNPKYNDIQKREEYNWNLCLTYPYECYFDNFLIQEVEEEEVGEETKVTKINALLVETCEKNIGVSGENIILFKMFFNHNLSIGDAIRVYYKNEATNDKYEQLEELIKVTKIGNVNGENENAYFYTRDVEQFEAIDEELFNETKFRIVRVVNDNDCQYYIRKFRKLPNLRRKQEDLTDEVAQNKDEDSEEPNYPKYVNKNARTIINDEEGESPMLPFTCEIYPLAFARTIYSDQCTQYTYTDTIDISHLVDNLGRPLTEMYVTIVKNNKGYEKFYSDENGEESSEIEYSHCFGKLTSGLRFVHNNPINQKNRNSYADNSDVEFLNDLDCFKNYPLQEIKRGQPRKKHSECDNITIDDDWFFGDIVEYNINDAIETVLSDVHFRFNTAQRESKWFQNKCKFFYDEITSDDFDLDEFKVYHHDADLQCDSEINELDCIDNSDVKIDGLGVGTTLRPEGYFYKAHYKVQLREFSDLIQSSHPELRIIKAQPIQTDKMYIQITTAVVHNLSRNDRLYICDDENDIFYDSSVVNVIDRRNVVINVLSEDEPNWVVICNAINSEDEEERESIKIRKKNQNIPSYATRLDKNTFVWRDVLPVGTKGGDLELEYPFTNGYFYIERGINFFLKRQDPFGELKLYSENVNPNDIYGNASKVEDKVYAEMNKVTC